MILLQFDSAWEHEWESLASVLSGIGDEEANWQAPCYRDVPAIDGWPPPGTIRWHVAHVAHCKREYGAWLWSPKRGASHPSLPHHPTKSYEEDLQKLRQAHADQRAAIVARVDARDLDERVADFLASTLRHDTWHGGQIAVVRRLWRTRDGGR